MRMAFNMFGAMLLLSATAPTYASDDPPTEFSKSVTGITGDWVADDWRRGRVNMHPSKFTWQSDLFLAVSPEEPVNGRTPMATLQAYFPGEEVDDNKIDMRSASEISPGIIAKKFRWESGFDDNLGFWGLVTTKAGSYVSFHSVCDFGQAEQYTGELCLRKMLTLLLSIQNGTLKIPEPPTPLNVPGWEGQYSADGTSILTNSNYNGLRVATIYASSPRNIPPNDLPLAIRQFAEAMVDDLHDQAKESPPSQAWVGTTSDPWIRRTFAEAFDGPSIHMAGSLKMQDGRTVLLAVRCPNAGWQTSCAYGIDQAKQHISSGLVEARRQRTIAATQVPMPTNGLKDAQILGIYTQGRNTMGAGGYMTGYEIDGHLYLRDGSVYKDFDAPPAYIDPVSSRQKNAARWGRWRQVGGNIAITWGDGDTDTVPVNADNLMVGGSTAMRLTGEYKHVSGGGIMGMSSSLSESSYTFRPDGTFDSARSSSFSVGTGMGETGNVAMGGSSGGGPRGHYAVNGYTMTLTYPDGRISRLSFAVYKQDIANPKRDLILLNGTVYFLNTAD